ncbi:MAG: hypothetical protein AMXMBFR33_28840 [Candidatus Xenobia bacterium]
MSEAGTKNALEEQNQKLQEENLLLREQLSAYSSGSIDLKLIESNQFLKAECERLQSESRAVGEKNVDLVLQLEDLEDNLRAGQGRESQLNSELEAHKKKLEEAQKALEERQQTFQTRLLEASTELADLQSRVTELEADLRSREGALEAERARAASLEEGKTTLASRVQELEAGQAELRAQLEVAQRRLKELESEKTRADELDKRAHELAAQLHESEEHLQGLRESSKAEGEKLRKTKDELESARAESARLQSELSLSQQEAERLKTELASQGRELTSSQARVQTLESNISELKQVVLEGGSRAEAAPSEAPSVAGESFTGSPQEVLTAAMTEVLGSTGQVLVNRVYYRCGIEPESTDADELDLIVKSLDDTAARLVQSPEQRGRLTALLDEFRQSLASGAARVTLSARPAPEPEKSEESRPVAAPVRLREPEAEVAKPEPVKAAPEPEVRPAEPEPEPEVVVRSPEPEPEPEVVVRSPEPEPEPELILRSPEPPSAPVESVDSFLSRLETEEEPEKAVEKEEPVFLSATDLLAKLELEDNQDSAAAAKVLETASHDVHAHQVEVEEESDAQLPVEVLDFPPDPNPLQVTQDATLLAEVEKGMTMLKHLNMDESFEFFSKLHQDHPNVAQVEAGLFYNYASFSCWMEAYEIGRRMLPVMIRAKDNAQFITTMTTVLNERIGQSRSMAEKKRCLLELAELHLADSEQAVDYLRRAKRIPNPIRGEGRIDYYLTCLLAGTPEDRSTYVRNYMGSVADSDRLFTHLDEIYKENRHRNQAPVARAIVALGRGSLERAQAAEGEAGAALAPVEADPDLLEQNWSKAEPGILKLFLDNLITRAKVSARFPAPRFHEWLDQSKPAPDGWKPKVQANEDNDAIFKLGRLTVHRYEGPERFMVRAAPEPEATLIVNQEVESLPEGQLRFFLLSALFQVKRRHLHLYRAAEALDDEGRVRLLLACRDHVLQSGVDITDALTRKIEAFSAATPDFSRALQTLLEQLYEHTLSDEFDQLREFMFDPTPFREQLEGAADRFATRLVGLCQASYAAAYESLSDRDLLEKARRDGFRVLYRKPPETHREARLRLQRIWLGPLLRAHQ